MLGTNTAKEGKFAECVKLVEQHLSDGTLVLDRLQWGRLIEIADVEGSCRRMHIVRFASQIYGVLDKPPDSFRVDPDPVIEEPPPPPPKPSKEKPFKKPQPALF